MTGNNCATRYVMYRFARISGKYFPLNPVHRRPASPAAAECAAMAIA